LGKERAVMVDCRRLNDAHRRADLRGAAFQADRWLVQTPDSDPCAPVVRVIAVLEEPDYPTR